MKAICKRLLVLVFATLPVLCLTVTAANALFAALAVFVSLMAAVGVRQLGDKIIPESAKNIVVLIAIALGISLVEMFTAGLLSADKAAESFMPLCAVPAILLLGQSGAAKTTKAKVFSALIIGGLFGALLLSLGILRELIGTGGIFGASVTRSLFKPIEIFALPAGAIFIIALFIAVLQHIAKEDEGDA